MQPYTDGASFFRLAGEIRTKIYNYALFSWPADPISCRSKEEHVTAAFYAMRDSLRPLTDSLRPLTVSLRPSRNALALTCRQAYFESARVFYEDNYFCVWSGAIFGAWFHSIARVHIQAIEQLTLKKAAFHRPGTKGFICQRVGPATPEPGRDMHWVYDKKFMCDRQIRKLTAFTNLVHLRIVGRFHPPRQGQPPHPPLKLFRRLVALKAQLPRLEMITVVSQMHKKYNFRYGAGRLTAMKELRRYGWGYDLRFNRPNKVLVEDHVIEVMWQLKEHEKSPSYR